MIFPKNHNVYLEICCSIFLEWDICMDIEKVCEKYDCEVIRIGENGECIESKKEQIQMKWYAINLGGKYLVYS